MTDETNLTGRRSPISRVIRAGALPKDGLNVAIDADRSQCDTLARDHGLYNVGFLEARLSVGPRKRAGARVRGRVRAQITQQCVVTLEPIGSVIEEEIDLMLLPEHNAPAKPEPVAREVIFDPDSEDDPETFRHGKIDVGAIAEEFFTLAIEPYPRSDDAVLAFGDQGVPGDEKQSPFAKLAELKRGR